MDRETEIHKVPKNNDEVVNFILRKVKTIYFALELTQNQMK